MNTSPPGLLADVSHHIEPLIRHLPKIFRDQPALWTSTTLLGLSALWLRKNYREFKAIGRGGLPYNVRGWLIALFLKLFSRETLSTLEYDRDPNKERWIEDADSIPVRKSSRPGSGFHVVPARQTNQLPTKEMMVLLDRFFAHLVKQNSDYLEFQRSPHETLHDGVVLKSTLPAPHDVAKRAIREVAHIHPLDHSMHVLLAPQDCKFVIERGWGERHKLSGSRALRALPIPEAAKLPKEYIWIYAPRDVEELAVVQKIILAGARFMTNSRDIKYVKL